MNILIFAQSLSIGGAERVASLWATGFSNQGHKVQIALMKENEHRSYPIPSNVSVVSANGQNKNKIVNFISRFRRTGEIIKSFNPDVILVVLHVQDFPIWFYTRKTNIKIIQTEHNSYERPIDAPFSIYEKFVKFYRNRMFDAVTVLTDADKKIIGNRLKNVIVLPNPLSFPPVKEIPNKSKYILAVGRLDVYYCKGFDLLIKSFANIHEDAKDWKLKIVGSGSDSTLQYLKRLSEINGVSRDVDFIPFTDNLLPLYQNSEIFCLSSRYEGFGMVLIEAMSQGCACIACDFKGRQKEIIISEEYGMVCPADNQDALEKKLKELILNENLRRQIQLKSPEGAARFELNAIMDRWNQIFKDLLS